MRTGSDGLGGVEVYFATEPSSAHWARNEGAVERALSDESGSFELRHALRLPGYLVFRKPGYLSKEVSVEGSRESVDLRPAASVRIAYEPEQPVPLDQILGTFKCVWIEVSRPVEPTEFLRGRPVGGVVRHETVDGVSYLRLDGVQAANGDHLRIDLDRFDDVSRSVSIRVGEDGR